MNKSIFLKGSALALGLMLMSACTKVDSPVQVEPEDPIIQVELDLTNLVATDGWGQGGFAGSWAAPEVTTLDGRTSGMAEVYKSTNEDVAATGVVMQQKIEALPNGHYTVALYANAMFTPDRGFASDLTDGAMDVVYVFANEAQTPVKAQIATSTTENGKYVVETDVTDGTLTIGIAKAKGGTNWHTIQIASLACTQEAPLSELYKPLLDEAEALLAEKMSEEAKKTLNEAIALPHSKEAMDNLALAIALAKGSINSYKIIAAGGVPNDKLDNWICTNTNTFHINTWSVEGNEGNDPSGMVTPFIENWVGKPGPLGEGDIFLTLPMLTPGEKYTVSALIRVYSESGEAVSGAFFGSEDIAKKGTAFEYNGMKGVYGTFTQEVTVDENGSLLIGLKIANPTFNWVAIKDVKIAAK